VFEDDETGVERRGVAKNVLPVQQNLGRRDSSCADVEVWKGSVSLHTSKLKFLIVPPVSNVAVGLMRVHMIGFSPIAKEMARTRSSISPKGGRIVLGVTPKTSLIIFLDQPSSAMICSLVRVVRGAE
jgi:hypothetical protein